MKVLFIILCFTYLSLNLAAQSMSPVIEKAKKKIEALEKAGRIVEKTVFDFLYKQNSSKYAYVYDFDSRQSYSLTVIGDELKVSSNNLVIYKYTSGKWVQFKQYYYNDFNRSLSFEPDESSRYKIEISCSFLSTYATACIGLIIDREM